MIIAGLVKTSVIDYPEKIAAIVFTYGCNFRCGFCHNPDIVIGKKGEYQVISEKEFFEFLKKRKGVLDGVVITGGEPLLNPKMPEFCKKIKDMGFLVKMDTNGTNPEMLQELIDSKLIDYIATDIKNSLEKYNLTTNTEVNLKDIQKSIDIIKNSGLPYEFRSTILPKLHEREDFHKMGEMIRGAKKFYLQGFRRGITLDPDYSNEKSFTREEMNEIKKILDNYVVSCEIRENQN